MLKNKLTRSLIVKYREFKCVISKKLKYIIKCVLGKFDDNKVAKPTTLQLPITYKCNFDCVMCGMKSLKNNKDFSIEEMEKILRDDLFSNIESVGVNGGEPFILNNLVEYIKTLIITLPKLKNIYLISNGYFTDRVLDYSKKIKLLCHEHKIMYHLSISIDGFGETHNRIRGNSNAFDNAINTCKNIIANPNVYCDTFNTICTITKLNVYNLVEIDLFSKQENIPITYNIATIHKRLNNENKYADFSIFTEEKAQKVASEFLYSIFMKTKSEMYFARYYYARYKIRIAICRHKSQVVTLTPNGAISYCATFSKEIGVANESSAKSIYFDNNNLEYRKQLQKEHCFSCSHYTESLSKVGYKLYFKEVKKLYRFKF